jgi:serine/threonine-protein kinase
VQLDEKVALKFLLPEAIRNPEASARFDREARAAVKIKSEHVARVIDVGKLTSGAPYMVMEYLDGLDLSSWLAERGPLPVEQAVEFVLQACEAIAEAHALGIVHRDLKPANLYCIRRPDGSLSIKVLDFGISKAGGAGASLGMTKTHTVMGSPLYMSPEQMQSARNADARSDIWALGIVLFELLTGRVPFDAEQITELVLKIMATPTPTLAQLGIGVPQGLDRVIQRCLEKDRERRYASIFELANDLVAFGPPRARLSMERIAGITGAAGTAPRPSFHPATPAGAPTPPMAAISGLRPTQGMTGSSWGQTGGGAAGVPGGASRALAWLGGVVVLLLVGTGAAWLVVAREGSPTAPRSSALASPPTAAESAARVPPAAASAPPSGSVADDPAPPAPSSVARGTSAATGQALTRSPPAPPVAASPAHPAATGAKTASSPAGAPKASCDPPYSIDSAGHRQYKPECL